MYRVLGNVSRLTQNPVNFFVGVGTSAIMSWMSFLSSKLLSQRYL